MYIFEQDYLMINIIFFVIMNLQKKILSKSKLIL